MDNTPVSSTPYNYSHFHAVTLGEDARLVMKPEGPMPGDLAPEFSLEDSQGRSWQLSDFRGQPVVLIFGSGTCPMTVGSLPGLKKLAQEFGDDVQWLMVYVREAHPGELLPAHESMMQKREQAERLRQAEGVDWPVLIDDTDGTTHKAYDEMPNPVFVIDRDGHVAFRGEFAHAPTLWQALQALQAQGWRGMAPHPLDKKPHMLGATVVGWRGPERGGEIAQHDLMKGAPPLALNLRLGQWMEPILGPLASRSRPLPPSTKLALVAGGLGLLILLFKRRSH
ncbi:peroxiredoxin family protein [Pseudomonas aeruginosa]